MASENTIYFYPGRGGHSHDGENSSFIDTSKYSLFDFSWGIFGDPSRIADQTRNYISFENFIIDTVNNAVLKPANIILQPGTVNGTSHIVSRSIDTGLITANAITANEIMAGTITADELSANIVLINNVISSNNYVTGVSGWAIDGDGTAEFANTSIRGTVEAGSLTTPGITIDEAGNLTADNFALYANGKIENGNFSVSAAGVLYATGASISGTIEASSVATPGIIIDANGDLTAGGGATVLFADGSIVTSSGNFGVDASGNLYAENAIIYGEIYANTGTIDGDIISGGTISGVELQIGSNFYVDASGNLQANNASLTGTINASAGQIGGYSINGTSLYSATISLQSSSIQVNQGNDPGFVSLGGGGASSASRFNQVGFQNPSISGWDTNFYPYIDSSGNLGVNSGGFQFRWNNINYVGTLSDTSDERTKTSISTLPSMLPLIDSLNPVSYLKKIAYTESMIPLPDNGKRAGARKHFGLIAQEVRSAMNANGFDVNEYSGWGMVDKDDPESEQMLMYLEFIAILLKGVQELSQKVSALENAV